MITGNEKESLRKTTKRYSQILKCFLHLTKVYMIKLRLEMVNVSKRQPDQGEENSQRPQMGLQNSEKIQHPETMFIQICGM